MWMAGKLTTENRDELLAQVLEALKRHEHQLSNLFADVEGLKQTLTGADRLRSDPRKETVKANGADELATQSRLFDEAIARLRGI
jgi:hypothetical protein